MILSTTMLVAFNYYILTMTIHFDVILYNDGNREKL